jgi:carbon-monoxide dehydrogenase iron sulfur subunit
MKRLFVESTDEMRMPIICRHCEDAPCLRACISGCLYRDEKGFVRRKKERCIGCWTCMMMCPFGVITRDKEKHIAVKCDRCHKLDVPACVNACPTGALVLADIDAVPKEKRNRVILAETKGEG